MEITEEKLKKILNEQKNDFKRYIGVLSEDFQSQTKLIAESISGIQQQLIAIKEMVAKNTEDIEMMKVEIFSMRKDMLGMKKDIEIMKSDIGIIKQNLRRKVDLEDFEILEKRVMFLEKKIATG